MHKADLECASPFEARWLAEALRLREQQSGALDDRQALQLARASSSTDLEERILVRAQELATEINGLGQIRAWRARGTWVAVLLVLGVLVLGFLMAFKTLGAGERHINVFWLLLVVLGVHGLYLLIWLLGLGWSRRSGAAPDALASKLSLGQLWLTLSKKMTTAGEPALALAGLLHRGRLTPWWLGLFSHGFWSCMLMGVLAGLVVALLLWRYVFVWETTILSYEYLLAIVRGMGALPAKLGFAVPDEAMIRASQLTSAPASALLGADEFTQKTWSNWVFGCIVTYGLLPRLLCALWCWLMLKRGLRRIRLDLSLPAYALLATKIMPDSVSLGVCDPAPQHMAKTQLSRPVLTDALDQQAAIIGVELRPNAGWPPPLPAGVVDGGVLDGRAQRCQALAKFAATPPCRLLVVCDVLLSPDRGSFNLITSLSQHAGECRVWLQHVTATRNDVAQRLDSWKQGLRQIGLAEHAIFDTQQAALSWLGSGNA